MREFCVVDRYIRTSSGQRYLITDATRKFNTGNRMILRYEHAPDARFLSRFTLLLWKKRGINWDFE